MMGFSICAGLQHLTNAQHSRQTAQIQKLSARVKVKPCAVRNTMSKTENATASMVPNSIRYLPHDGRFFSIWVIEGLV